MRALIVDDEEDIAGLLDLGLRDAGFATEHARDGETALRLALDHPPDLVVLDRTLPGLSGDEVCRALKREPKTCRVPILMVTSRAGERDRIEGLLLGADDYVTKPFFLRELLLRCQALARRGPLPVVEPAGDPLPPWARELPLTAGEHALLVELLRHEGRVCEPSRLMAVLPRPSRRSGIRALRARLRKLRVMFERCGARLTLLRGVGYRFDSPPP